MVEHSVSALVWTFASAAFLPPAATLGAAAAKFPSASGSAGRSHAALGQPALRQPVHHRSIGRGHNPGRQSPRIVFDQVGKQHALRFEQHDGSVAGFKAGVTLTIDGNGDTINGSNQFRLFDVQSGASLTLNDLTLTGGLAQGMGMAAEGWAVYSSGKQLTLNNVTVKSNRAVGSNGSNGGNGASASGGGIYVAKGIAVLNNDVFSNNQAVGGDGGAAGNASGSHGIGGIGGNGGAASGGGMYVAARSVTLTNDTFSSNRATGSNGGAGGNGFTGGNAGSGGNADGGGMYVAGGAVTLNTDALSSNHAAGGNGGNGGASGNSLTSHFVGGIGGNGGNATGGGLYVFAGVTVLGSHTTITNNMVTAGNGGGPDGVAGTASFADIAANSSGLGDYVTS